MRRLVSVILLTGCASSALAECFEATNVKGATMINGDHYQLSDDGYGDQVFRITIEGDKASVPESGLECAPLRDTIALCYGSPELVETTIEVYSIDRAASRLILTQSRTGFPSPLEAFNGGKVMIGDIVGNCEPN